MHPTFDFATIMSSSSSSSSSHHRSIPTEDRISSLPDSIVSHILSFLPTKSAAATSILSKRWKPVWLSLFDIHHDDQNFKDLITFLPCPILSHAIAKHELQILSVKSIWHIYNQVPDFHNLTQMEIFFSNFKCRSWRDKWIWMLQMLQHSPKLQDLIIHEEMEDGICEDNWQDPQVVPECLSSQLRTCLIRDWRGRQSELQFLQYVMRNSMVLHTLTIHNAKSINFIAQYKMLQKLLNFQRGSSICEFIFD